MSRDPLFRFSGTYERGLKAGVILGFEFARDRAATNLKIALGRSNANAVLTLTQYIAELDARISELKQQTQNAEMVS
jgi:hypothetical protein